LDKAVVSLKADQPQRKSERIMRTNIEIDDALMAEAIGVSTEKTKKAVVEAALTDYIRLHRQREMLKSFGTIEWEGDLDEMRTDKPDSPWFS
jgi:Arc/MetJ family transcription regulator